MAIANFVGMNMSSIFVTLYGLWFELMCCAIPENAQIVSVLLVGI